MSNEIKTIEVRFALGDVVLDETSGWRGEVTGIYALKGGTTTYQVTRKLAEGAPGSPTEWFDEGRLVA